MDLLSNTVDPAVDLWTRGFLISFFSLSVRLGQGLRQSTHRSQFRPSPSFVP